MRGNKIKTSEIVENIGAGLCLLDREYRVIWMNKNQSEWFGLPEDIYGKHCYKIFQKRSRICPACPTRKVFKTGALHIAGRLRGFTKNGERRYYQLTVSPIRDNAGRVIYALELIQDVTDKLIQDRLNTKIKQRLSSMCQNFRAANKRLSKSVNRLKEITWNLTKSKQIAERRYRRKENKLLAIKEELQDIFKVNHVLASDVDLKKICSLITRLTCELIRTDACLLKLLNEENKTLVIKASYCLSSAFLKHSSVVKIGEGISGIVAKTKRPLAICDIDKDPRVRFKELLKKEGLKSLLAVPVVFRGGMLGVVSTGSKRKRIFSKDEIELLNAFAAQVAVAIQESRYYDSLHINYYNTIHALVLAIESRDPYIRGHTQRVTKYALQVAKELKLSETELETLRYAAEVHDVGKISISDFILHKPGKLNPAERAMIELHPVKGTEMLEPLGFLRSAITIVRHHHERYDGRGYPDGLKKEEIPLMARILSCADSFDAMTSDRPYRRRKLTIEEALREMKNNSGSQFDPHIAHLFIKIIRNSSPLKALT